MRIVKIFEYNKQWEKIFKKEISSITSILGEELIQVYHIVSTAIPNIRSKSVIDIMLEVRDVARLDTFNRTFEKFEYEIMGEFGIKGRRFYWANIQEKVIMINGELGPGNQIYYGTQIQNAGNSNVNINVIAGHGYADLLYSTNAEQNVWTHFLD